MKRVAFHNLGCKVNDYESDIMQQKFMENGFQVVPFSEKSDVYVINTCTVTNMADRKSRQMLHRARKQNPDAIVVGVGCYVQTDMEHISKDPAVDILIGNNEKTKVCDLVLSYMKDNKKIVDVIDINHTDVYEPMFLSDTADRTRAYIKIQDGCNQFCSYCLIPYARGRVRSRDMDEILREIQCLCQKGYQEFVLTGIHVSSYGITTSNDLSGNRLGELLTKINALEDVKRIRLSSLEPRVMTEEFVKTIASLEKLCPHFHLSLQSGCDATLKRMNRHYTTDMYRNGVSLLRKYFDHPAITTDIIVGFPGETKEEFEESFSFAREIGFYEIHVFKYSKRKGTVAEKLPNQVSDADKDARSDRMIALSQELSKRFLESYLGKTSKVLFEEEKEIDGKCYWIGHTPEYIRCVKEANEDLSNQIRQEKLLEPLNDEMVLLL